MRNALLDELYALTEVELLVLQDERVAISEASHPIGMQYAIISQGTDIQSFLCNRQTTYDAVWLIAPETDGILAKWCQFFSEQGKDLYTSAKDAVEICQDKLATLSLLQSADISCVPSRIFSLSTEKEPGKWVLKINGSVGCDEVYLLESEQHWQGILPKLSHDRTYILQPYISGKVLSLSCLFYQGDAYYICCNEQHMQIEEQQFVLSACTVNVQSDKSLQYQSLCQDIAEVIPQLFGYVGIDFIETHTGENLILEINPRLTSSYAGINAALGINVAESVLAMLEHKPPVLNRTKNQQVHITIDQGRHHAY